MAAHETSRERADDGSAAGAFVEVCTCGWAGPLRVLAGRTTADGEEHVAEEAAAEAG